MGSKRGRRDFLKSGATLAGGLTLGAAAPALGQEPATHDHAAPPMLKGDKDTIAYGVRSKYVTSVRIPHGGRPSPDQFRAHVPHRDAASGFGRRDHAILAPLRRDDPRRVPAGHRSQRTLVC